MASATQQQMHGNHADASNNNIRKKSKPGPEQGHNKRAPQASDEQQDETNNDNTQQEKVPTTKDNNNQEESSTTKWYELAHDKSSIAYDLIRVFCVLVVLFGVVGSVSWCCYRYCLVPCGICEDYYFEAPRDFRLRRNDGRGAFMPLTDAMDEDVWDSASSEDDDYSQEGGYVVHHHHSLEDEYGEFNMKLEEKNMFRASDTYSDAKPNGSKNIEMVQRNSRHR